MGRDGSIYFNGEGGIWKYDIATGAIAKTGAAFENSPGMRSSTRGLRAMVRNSLSGAIPGGITRANSSLVEDS